jgi:hypothetical protein
MRRRYPWAIWLAVGIWLEWTGWAGGGRRSHGTFSRLIQACTCTSRCRWSPLVWVGVGAWFAYHLRALELEPGE